MKKTIQFMQQFDAFRLNFGHINIIILIYCFASMLFLLINSFIDFCTKLIFCYSEKNIRLCIEKRQRIKRCVFYLG